MHDASTILADPNDFGNKPGDGPLRKGGTSVSAIPVGDGNRPDTRSEASKSQQFATKMCRDLFGGNMKVRAMGQTYLPRAPGETPDDYRARLNRSVFFNAFRQSVVGLTGLIYRRAPVLNDDVPPVIAGTKTEQGHWANIDMAGTSGSVFAKRVTEDAETVGHTCILVEMPQKREGATREDEARPYWVEVQKDDILSWRTANLDGATVLTQVVIERRTTIPNGMFGEGVQQSYLVIRRDLAFNTDEARKPDDPIQGSVTWQLLGITKANSVVVLDAGTYFNQTEIPLSEITTSGHVSMLVSEPPLIDVAFLNIGHYQMDSDLKTSIHKTCVPILVLSGVDTPRNTDGSDGPAIVAGPNTVFTLKNPAAKAYYASHSGNSIAEVQDALETQKTEMGTLGLSMLAPQKRSAETAEAKRLDKSQSDSALAATAQGVEDGINRALQFHANYLGLETGGTVSINRDFEGLLMAANVMEAYVSLREVGFPARIVLKALKEGGRIPLDEDLNILEAEMEANRIAEMEARALASAALASEGNDDAEVD